MADPELEMVQSLALLNKAKDLLNKHLSTCTISTSDGQGRVDVSIMNSAQFVDDTTIEALYLSESQTLRNLREAPKAVFSVAFPTEDNIWKIDGVRVWVELEREESDGADLARMTSDLEGHLPSRPIGRLVFRVVLIKPLWELTI
ncbi:MAG: pyridoxamine 5'-phosphate oxidase family protein [Promethearchaeota archaeon]